MKNHQHWVALCKICGDITKQCKCKVMDKSFFIDAPCPKCLDKKQEEFTKGKEEG